MGIMDIFNRLKSRPVETRAVSPGFTAQIMAARESWISGQSGIGELTAAAQASVSLWEAGLSLSDVSGTDLLSRHALAVTARSLALRGESVWLIRDRLVPAVDWDLSTRNGEPRAYRMSIAEAGGSRNETALAGEVLHFRIGSDSAAPWTGTAPLMRAKLSANLLNAVETALCDVFTDAPIGSQIVHVPDSAADDMDSLRKGFRGRRGQALVIEGVAQATAAGMHPNIGKAPDQLTPDLQRTLADTLLTDAKGAIYSAFGILPGLHNPATTGPLVREAQRHLAQLILQPICNLMAEECTAKIGNKVTVDCVRPMQAFDHGGKARAFAGMLQAMAQAKEAGLDDAVVQDALQFIDWAEE